MIPSLLTGLWIIVFALSRSAEAGSYGFGEFVLASRRGQFMGYRTPWMELLGRHCPMFARDRLVVVPIPQPTGFESVEEYKLSLEFDGGRFVTPWLTYLGAGAPRMPMLRIVFRYTGDEIRQVKAQIVEASGMLLDQYPHLRGEYAKADHWPKHLLVSYQWEDTREFDVDTGLYLVFTFGLIVSIIVGSRVVLQYKTQLAELLDAVVPEELVGPYGYAQPAVGYASNVPMPSVPIPAPGMAGWGTAMAGPKRD